MKTDPEPDEIIRELVEWMDGWELWTKDNDRDELYFKNEDGDIWNIEVIKQSLDLTREIEVAVRDNPVDTDKRYIDLGTKYVKKLSHIANGFETNDSEYDFLSARLAQDIGDWEEALIYADPKPRLIALHRTLKESGEI
jgi:hypothetical protein